MNNHLLKLIKEYGACQFKAGTCEVGKYDDVEFVYMELLDKADLKLREIVKYIEENYPHSKDEILRKEAINKSIEKWEAIVSGTGRDAGITDCALCELYYDTKDTEKQIYTCLKCPVRKKTGVTGCMGTPYIEWSEHHYQHNVTGNHQQDFSGKRIHCSECSRIALKELDFLKSLR